MNMKRVYMILLALICAVGCCDAQLIHTKGQMGLGFRGGVGLPTRVSSIDRSIGYNIGLFYNLYTSNQLGLLIELDREKKEFRFSDFTNQVLLGVGCEYAVWKPCKWLYMNLDLCGNVGYDEWNCTVMDWDEKHLVFGMNGGWAMEAYPWHFLSFVLKARQFVLFGKGENYLKPDFSLGVKANW